MSSLSTDIATEDSTSLLSLPPLSLYVHMPWCIRKCPYCDFNSHESRGEIPYSAYIDALISDLKQEQLHIQHRSVHSVFIGGGTPSLFPPAEIARLLNAVQKIIPFQPAMEITMEANPGTFEQEKFNDFRAAGINRLSIGIQSFDSHALKILGRVHDGDEALKAADIARKAGFDNFNLDLMYALPGQDVAMALKDLETAIAQNPAHLSWYQLTIEPNTAFYRYPPDLPDENLLMDIQEAGQALLKQAGYEQYEISAYAHNQQYSQHNLNYWEFGDYLGIGAGAHGKITLPGSNAVIRTRKTRQPAHYLDINTAFLADASPVARDEIGLEFMMNTMRLTRGSDLSIFTSRTGLDEASIETELTVLREKGLLNADKLAPTPKGRLFLNDLLGHFV